MENYFYSKRREPVEMLVLQKSTRRRSDMFIKLSNAGIRVKKVMGTQDLSST